MRGGELILQCVCVLIGEKYVDLFYEFGEIESFFDALFEVVIKFKEVFTSR